MEPLRRRGASPSDFAGYVVGMGRGGARELPWTRCPPHFFPGSAWNLHGVLARRAGVLPVRTSEGRRVVFALRRQREGSLNY